MIRGIFAFNCCPEHQQFMASLLSKWKVNYVVETGTFYGYTTAFLAERIKYVFTIEITPDRWNVHGKAKDILRGYENITILEGNSPEILPSILKNFPSEEQILFYLDAHGYLYWPLLDELNIIAKYVGPRAIIIIDDIKVPGKNYGYDTYNGKENSLELIDQYLKKIYANYKYEYFNGPLEFQLVLDENQLNPLEKEIYRDVKGSTMTKSGKILIQEGTDF